jgi:hypothetical protein
MKLVAIMFNVYIKNLLSESDFKINDEDEDNNPWPLGQMIFHFVKCK